MIMGNWRAVQTLRRDFFGYDGLLFPTESKTPLTCQITGQSIENKYKYYSIPILKYLLNTSQGKFLLWMARRKTISQST